MREVMYKEKKTLWYQFNILKVYYSRHQNCLTKRQIKNINKYLKKLEKELL